MTYDAPDFTLKREQYFNTVGGGATTNYAKFRSFSALTLSRVLAAVVTAGTATTHKLDIMSGTTSIGTIALGTQTAGSIVTATPSVAIPAQTQISVKTGADAVGTADVTFEYQLTPS
jgi:hypothetical protein